MARKHHAYLTDDERQVLINSTCNRATETVANKTINQ